jgi:N utilization substance protein A
MEAIPVDIDNNNGVIALLSEEIPEIANGLVEIKAVARIPGIRSKIAILSQSPNIDAMGVCVGVGGCRLHRIIDRLNGERIELVTWHDAMETLIANALQPAKIDQVHLDLAQERATVVVTEDQLSLVSGSSGSQNRELASRLCGWELEVVTK